MTVRVLLATVVAQYLFSTANANGLVVKRTGPPARPSCVDFTPFVYAGCFRDDSSPRTLLYASNLDFKTMTIEKCVAFCKGNDYRYAGLEYYGQCWCGATVGGAQTDESKCAFPCNGNKTESCGGNNALSIYQDPTFLDVDPTTIADYKSMGCYSEGPNGRTLAWRQSEPSSSSLTVESCLTCCKKGGYAFAGMEFGRECYCGVVLGNGTVPLGNEKCNIPCTGDKSESCGGRSTLNLYVAADLESTEPCVSGNPPIPSSSSSAIPPGTSLSVSSTIASSLPSVSPRPSSSVPVRSSTSSSVLTTLTTQSSLQLISSTTPAPSNPFSTISPVTTSEPIYSESSSTIPTTLSPSSPISSVTTSEPFSSDTSSKTIHPSDATSSSSLPLLSSNLSSTLKISTSTSVRDGSSSSKSTTTTAESPGSSEISPVTTSEPLLSSSTTRSIPSPTLTSASLSTAPVSPSSSRSSLLASSSAEPSTTTATATTKTPPQSSFTSPSASPSPITSTMTGSSTSLVIISSTTVATSSPTLSPIVTSSAKTSSSLLFTTILPTPGILSSIGSSSTATNILSSSISSSTLLSSSQPTTPVSVSASPTSSSSSTLTSGSVCVTTTITYPTPACEYKVGNFCATPIAPFSDPFACLKSYASCIIQLSVCYRNAGFPDSLNCEGFADYCSYIREFCDRGCPGYDCSLSTFKTLFPPPGQDLGIPMTSSSMYPCSLSKTTLKSSLTATPTKITTPSYPVPTDENLCIQPNNPSNGYGTKAPVGNIPLPYLTCNNDRSDYNNGKPFKLYTSPDSSKCPSYPRTGEYGPARGCRDACDNQYSSCTGTYAESWRGYRVKARRGGVRDTYSGATKKCKNQRDDCYSINDKINGQNQCESFKPGY